MRVLSDAALLQAFAAVGGISCTVNGELVCGVFRSEYTGAQPGDSFVQSRTPQFKCRECDALTVRNGMRFEHPDGSIYRVMGREPDGQGSVTLRLERHV